MSCVLITGASGGIGEDMAKIFAEKGHDLILVARSKSKLEALSKQLNNQFGIKAEVIDMDLSEVTSADELYKKVQKKKIKVDILVNNAGFGMMGYFHEMDFKRQSQMLHLNVTTLTTLTHLFLVEMIKDGAGKILNVSSTAAFQPGPLMSTYYATKAYVLFFGEGLSQELKGTGVSISTLCPGPTKSGFQAEANIETALLLKLPIVMTSAQVAKKAYEGLMKKQVIIVPGFFNKIMAISIRFTPRFVVRWLLTRLHQSVS